MVDVTPDEPVLLLRRRVHRRVAHVGRRGVVVVVRPLGKVVGELERRQVGARVLEVDDDELLVLVGGLEEG